MWGREQRREERQEALRGSPVPVGRKSPEYTWEYDSQPLGRLWKGWLLSHREDKGRGGMRGR